VSAALDVDVGRRQDPRTLVRCCARTGIVATPASASAAAPSTATSSLHFSNPLGPCDLQLFFKTSWQDQVKRLTGDRTSVPVAWYGGRAPCMVRRLCASSCLCSRPARCSPNSQSSTTAVRSTRLPWRPLVCPTLPLHVAVCSLCSARTSAPPKARRCRSLSLRRSFDRCHAEWRCHPGPFRSSSRLRRSTRCPRYPIREHLGGIPGDAQCGDLSGPGLLNFRLPIRVALPQQALLPNPGSPFPAPISPANPRASVPTASPSSSATVLLTPNRPAVTSEPVSSMPWPLKAFLCVLAPLRETLFPLCEISCRIRPPVPPRTLPGCTIVNSRGSCLKSDVVTPDGGWFVPGRHSPSFTFNPLGW
jgi:hypothetical protein